MENIESFNNKKNEGISRKINLENIKKGFFLILIEKDENNEKRIVIDVKKVKNGKILGEISGSAIGSNEIRKVVLPCNTVESQWDLSANFLEDRYFLETNKKMEMVTENIKEKKLEPLSIKPTAILIDKIDRNLQGLEDYANQSE